MIETQTATFIKGINQERVKSKEGGEVDWILRKEVKCLTLSIPKRHSEILVDFLVNSLAYFWKKYNILVSCKDHFIRAHKNHMQQSSYKI